MSKQLYEHQLSQLGFSEKEVKVYVTSLSLGPSTVQNIAEKSGVKRATVYVMIESLVTRGLMSSFVHGKKTFYKAEDPGHLLHLLNEESKKLAEKKAALHELLPYLASVVSTSSEHPNVKLFSGIDGLKAIHNQVMSARVDELLNIVAVDDAEKLGLTEHDDVVSFRKDLAKRRVRVRGLYASAKKKKLAHDPGHLWELKQIPTDFIPFHGEITVFGDKVAFFSFRGALVGSIIESSAIAQAMRVLFELAWTSSKLH